MRRRSVSVLPYCRLLPTRVAISLRSLTFSLRGAGGGSGGDEAWWEALRSELMSTDQHSIKYKQRELGITSGAAAVPSSSMLRLSVCDRPLARSAQRPACPACCLGCVTAETLARGMRGLAESAAGPQVAGVDAVRRAVACAATAYAHPHRTTPSHTTNHKPHSNSQTTPLSCHVMSDHASHGRHHRRPRTGLCRGRSVQARRRGQRPRLHHRRPGTHTHTRIPPSQPSLAPRLRRCFSCTGPIWPWAALEVAANV